VSDPLHEQDEASALPEQAVPSGDKPQVDVISEASDNKEKLPATPGAWLKLTREQAGLSEDQVAKDLFLDTRVIRALELDQYVNIGAPVYVKGYLRRYAKILGLAEAAVIERYESMQGTPRATDPIPVSHNRIPAPRQALPVWVWWCVIAAVVAAGVVTLMDERKELIPSAVIQAVISPSSTTSSSPLNTPLANISNAAASSAADASTADATATLALPTHSSVVKDTPTDPQNVSAGLVLVRLQFNNDSWVEIYDANQRTVMYEMGTAGATRSVQGMPPLRVTLGSALSVKVMINGKSVAVPAADIQADVAHFSINAAGHVE